MLEWVQRRLTRGWKAFEEARLGFNAVAVILPEDMYTCLSREPVKEQTEVFFSSLLFIGTK